MMPGVMSVMALVVAALSAFMENDTQSIRFTLYAIFMVVSAIHMEGRK